jgi:CDP-diglyceride synthetase
MAYGNEATRYQADTRDEQLKRRHWLTWLMDASIPLPGGYRIGLDGLIGLIPGAGDVIGGGISTWLLYQAYKQGLPKMVIARMLVNILIDAGLGSIPLVGDIFDFFWKANLKNAELLDRYKYSPEKTYRRSAIGNAIFLVGVVAVVVLLMYLVITIVGALWNALIQA